VSGASVSPPAEQAFPPHVMGQAFSPRVAGCGGAGQIDSCEVTLGKAKLYLYVLCDLSGDNGVGF